jgi:hypothetical protein
MPPRSLKPNEGVNLHRQVRSTLERPKCAALLGAICAEWSNAESFLGELYGRLLFGDFAGYPEDQMGGLAAYAAFDKVTSVKTRIAMLNVTAKERGIFPEPILKRFAALLKNVQSAGDDRITAAHGKWGVCDDLTTALVWTRSAPFRKEEALVYDEAALDEALSGIGQSAIELHRFFFSEMKPLLEAGSERFIRQILADEESAKAVHE